MDPTATFGELVAGPDEGIPLARAALVIAAHAYPGLDVDDELDAVHELAVGCPSGDLDEWHRHVFDTLSFTGNTVDYHDPRNSMLNEVVRRRLGIPITLAVVGMEIGSRLGIHLTGIGMPGHFLLHHEGLPPVFIDPFDGQYLDEAGCEAKFREVYGPEAPFRASYLAPAGARAILGRILANLRSAYLRGERLRGRGMGHAPTAHHSGRRGNRARRSGQAPGPRRTVPRGRGRARGPGRGRTVGRDCAVEPGATTARPPQLRPLELIPLDS